MPTNDPDFDARMARIEEALTDWRQMMARHDSQTRPRQSSEDSGMPEREMPPVTRRAPPRMGDVSAPRENPSATSRNPLTGKKDSPELTDKFHRELKDFEEYLATPSAQRSPFADDRDQRALSDQPRYRLPTPEQREAREYGMDREAEYRMMMERDPHEVARQQHRMERRYDDEKESNIAPLSPTQRHVPLEEGRAIPTVPGEPDQSAWRAHMYKRMRDIMSGNVRATRGDVMNSAVNTRLLPSAEPDEHLRYPEPRAPRPAASLGPTPEATAPERGRSLSPEALAALEENAEPRRGYR